MSNIFDDESIFENNDPQWRRGRGGGQPPKWTIETINAEHLDGLDEVLYALVVNPRLFPDRWTKQRPGFYYIAFASLRQAKKMRRKLKPREQEIWIVDYPHKVDYKYAEEREIRANQLLSDDRLFEKALNKATKELPLPKVKKIAIDAMEFKKKLEQDKGAAS